MKIQSRLIGHCTDKVVEQNLIQLDVNSLVQRLILFDTFILKSVRLRDLPSLLSIFGYGGLTNLLKTGALQLECGHLTSGEIRSTSSHPTEPLPLGSFSFTIASPGDYKQFLSRCFTAIEPETKLAKKTYIKLKETIAEHMLLPPNTGGNRLVPL